MICLTDISSLIVWVLYQLFDSDPSFFAYLLRICDEIQVHIEGSTDIQRYHSNIGLLMEKRRRGSTR